jgi:hypothetical protein
LAGGLILGRYVADSVRLHEGDEFARAGAEVKLHGLVSGGAES